MGTIVDVHPGCVVLIGFPHDEGAKRSGITAGSAAAPSAIRFYLRKLLSSPTNPEFGIDLSRIPILDVGDVPVSLNLEDALSRLDDSITEILNRGAVPIVIGGSGDLAYACASGLMTSSGAPIAVVDVNSSLNMDPLRVEQKIEVASTNRLLLSDTRFCPAKDTTSNGMGYFEPHCEGRFVIYGAQGTLCLPDAVNFVQHRGGHVVWLTKDIRAHDVTRHSRSHYSSSSSVVSDDQENTQQAVQQFLNSFGDEIDTADENFPSAPPLSSASLSPFNTGGHLPQLQRPPSESSVHSSIASMASFNSHSGLPPITSVPLPFSRLLKHLSRPSSRRPILVSFSLQAMNNASCPGVYIRSPNGLTVEEALEVCSASGSDSNVQIFTVTELNPLIEEARSASLAAELIYWFLLGYTNRRPRASLTPQNISSQPVYRMERSFSKTSVGSQRSPTSGNREYELTQDMLLAASLLSLSDAHDEA
eukprot:CAMPEP_0174826140 /NCGR_PEP_ID=MMETSP1107-20130205/43560_1 /TAXON_ID=36770 /ORGANISM="Paraphysomonas vestita, Strain GFlagA" /LENGTH=475 /DNA_ID=CAMNT_0016058651 /DNA_START=694 /DNA_END=2121 /DNA_ORIENTATION=+